jgi:hypothetical protein
VVVTAAYAELVTAIRQQARIAFDAEVRRLLVGAPRYKNISEQQQDIDFILELTDGKRWAIETPHWLRIPKGDSLAARYRKLDTAIPNLKLSGAILVTQKDVLSPMQRESAPAGVQTAVISELRTILAKL